MGLRDQGLIRGTGAYGRRQLGVVTKPTGLLLPRTPVHRNRVKYAGAPDALLQASSWYDARDLSNTTQQTLPNRLNPSASAAQLGSTSGSDTNDPVALPRTGNSYVYLPGTAANSLSVPDSAALSITGDIDIIACITAPDWTPASTGTIIAKRGGAGQVSWHLRLQTDGTLSFLWSTDGTSTATAVSSAAVSSVFADGAQGWMRATVDVNNGSSNSDFKFYTSSDGVTWSQLGATINGGSTTSFFDSTAAVELGAYNNATSFPLTYLLHRAIIKNGIDGTTVLDINPATENLGQFSWTCTTGQTVTVNRATSGLTTAVVTRPLLMADGTDDYLQLPAGDTPTFTATTGAYTVLIACRVRNSGTTAVVWSSETSPGNNGGLIFITAAGVVTARVGGASTSVTGTVATGVNNGDHQVVGLVKSGSTVQAFRYGTGLGSGANTSGVGVITHNTPRVAAFAYATSLPTMGEITATAAWTRALTAAELDAASAYLLGSYR